MVSILPAARFRGTLFKISAMKVIERFSWWQVAFQQGRRNPPKKGKIKNHQETIY
jgi:hypothetical protein